MVIILIKVENLNFTYDETKETIKDLTFNIPKGSWVSILGHNGSGKSTLAKLLVGLLKAESGNIYIDDILLTEDTVNDVRKKVVLYPIIWLVSCMIAFGLEKKYRVNVTLN